MTKKIFARAGAVAAAALVACGLAFSATPAQAAPAPLKLGSKGSDVKTLQKALNDNKRKDYFTAGSYTTYFGSVTQKGLKAWEKASGRKVDGKITVGSSEWKALMSEIKAKPKPSTTKPKKPSYIDARCMKYARVMCINKTTRKIYYMENGKIVQTLDARFGKASTPTRNGDFRVFRKVKNDYSYLYKTPMGYSMYFSGGQAVHYSWDFAARGYAGASHGCVNVRDWNGIKKLYSKIRIGDHVVVYR